MYQISNVSDFECIRFRMYQISNVAGFESIREVPLSEYICVTAPSFSKALLLLLAIFWFHVIYYSFNLDW